MIARIQPRPLRGQILAIPSKSEAHRALVCAALADAPCMIAMRGISDDVEATIRCLREFGAKITPSTQGIHVYPIPKQTSVCFCSDTKNTAIPFRNVDCGESGTTLRFLLPVAAALGLRVRFHMRARLALRPIDPLLHELERGCCTINRPMSDLIEISGHLKPGAHLLPGDISSQFISGMLIALSALDDESTLEITGRTESADYIRLTLDMLSRFGRLPVRTENGYHIMKGSFAAPDRIEIGGDWSNAAFWLCANRLPGCSVSVDGLNFESLQGDRRILRELEAMANGESDYETDVSDIPDLVPPLAVCACASGRSVRFTHASRLRMKESDRLASISDAIRALGCKISKTDDGLFIENHSLSGGVVDSKGDHRIAMMAGIASVLCTEPVTILGAEAVKKSYPAFWDDFQKLGGSVEFWDGGIK